MEPDAPLDRIPLHTDPDGLIRVGRTRVTLDTIIDAFDAGATAEEIAQRFFSVAFADVRSAIAYDLRHQADLRAYVARRRATAAHVHQESERRFDPAGVRDRLLGRHG